MKRFIIPFILLVAFFIQSLLVSCDKFLDVRPDEKTYINEVFENERGFVKALSGVYRSMTEPSLYGYQLKFGTMDLLVGYWTVDPTSDANIAITKYYYNDALAISSFNSIWSGLFNCIHQTNIIINQLPRIEGQPNYDIIAGEAYGLRAFLQLEALKVFGPVIKQEGLEAKGVPYILTDTRSPQKLKSAKEVLDLVEVDLQKAVELLKNDPIVKVGRDGNLNNPNLGNYNPLFDRRGIRMNLYAAKALLARKSLWEGDKKTAYERAINLINEIKASNAVRFINNHDLMGKDKNLHFTVENIFAVYKNNALTIFTEYFATNRLLVAYSNNLDYLYEGGTGSPEDIRMYWGMGYLHYPYFSKYFVQTEDGMQGHFYHPYYEMQLINLPELYFIGAEAKVDEDKDEALRLLQELRTSRKLMVPLEDTSPAAVKKLLIDEMRREYIGEGVLFSFYKRNFLPIPVTGEVIPASLNIYKIPIPVDESIYNQ